MKKQVLAAVMVGVFLLAGSGAAFAQAPVTSVSVPFEFVVGKTVLPAGSYVVTSVLQGRGALVLRSEDGKSGAVALVDLSDKPSSDPNATFSFVKIGGRCYLSAVSTPGLKAQVISLPKRAEPALTRMGGVAPVRVAQK